MKTPDSPDVTKLPATPAALAPVSGSEESCMDRFHTECKAIGFDPYEHGDDPNSGVCATCLHHATMQFVKREKRYPVCDDCAENQIRHMIKGHAKQRLYFFPVPCLGLVIQLRERTANGRNDRTDAQRKES